MLRVLQRLRGSFFFCATPLTLIGFLAAIPASADSWDTFEKSCVVPMVTGERFEPPVGYEGGKAKDMLKLGKHASVRRNAMVYKVPAGGWLVLDARALAPKSRSCRLSSVNSMVFFDFEKLRRIAPFEVEYDYFDNGKAVFHREDGVDITAIYYIESHGVSGGISLYERRSKH